MGSNTDNHNTHEHFVGFSDLRSGDARPLIGVTADIIEYNSVDRAAVPMSYARAIEAAGGLPVIIQPNAMLAMDFVLRLDGIVLSGGDDPRTEVFGAPTHEAAIPVRSERQEAELAILRAIESHRADLPVLGVCLGMQMMALHAGGRLDQHMPDTHPDAARHWEREHPVEATGVGGGLRSGVVLSKHRQAVDDPGRLAVAAIADDGIIEAVCDPERAFCVGVQWHAERTKDESLGLGLYRGLVEAAAQARARESSTPRVL